MDLSGLYIKGTGSYEVKEIATLGDLVINGRFNSDITGATITSKGTGGNAVVSHYTDNPISGSGSLRVIQTTAPSENFRPTLQIDLSSVPITGEKYRIRFKTKLLSGSVAVSNTNGVCIGGVSAGEFLKNEVFSGYQEWDVTTFNADDANPVFLVYFNSTGAFDLLIDDVFVEHLPALPTLDKGSTYLECTSAGTVAFPSDQAYGEWEFGFYKGAGSNPVFRIIASDLIIPPTNRYSFIISSGEALYLYRDAVSLMNTSGSYVDASIWYRIKITRTLNGEFYCYIKGGDFGTDDWTLIVPSVGTNPATDNTHTTSEYFVLDLDVGDRIATNLVMRKAVQQ